MPSTNLEWTFDRLKYHFTGFRILTTVRSVKYCVSGGFFSRFFFCSVAQIQFVRIKFLWNFIRRCESDEKLKIRNGLQLIPLNYWRLEDCFRQTDRQTDGQLVFYSIDIFSYLCYNNGTTKELHLSIYTIKDKLSVRPSVCHPVCLKQSSSLQ